MSALGPRPRSILTMANLDLPTDAAVTLLFLVNGRIVAPWRLTARGRRSLVDGRTQYHPLSAAIKKKWVVISSVGARQRRRRRRSQWTVPI